MDKVDLFPALSCSVNNELTAPSLRGMTIQNLAHLIACTLTKPKVVDYMLLVVDFMSARF